MNANSTGEPRNLWISETYVNATTGHNYGDTGVYEAYTADPGELYRSCQREYGRCTGRVYVDTPEGKPRAIGWVFAKRARYEDARTRRDVYLQETWITLHDSPPTTRTEYHYHDLARAA